MILVVAGQLTVNVLARATNFVREMRGARREVRGLGKDTRNAQTGIQGMVGFGTKMLGVAASVEGFRRVIFGSIDDIDRLSKASQKLGILPEELQFWEFAAKKARIQTRVLEIGMQRFSRRLSEAKRGKGSALNAIKELGVDIDKVMAMPLSDSFAEVLRVLGNIPNVNERIDRTNKFFDSEGVDLVRLAGMNMALTRKEFETFARAITKTDTDKIDELGDSFTRLSEIVKGVRTDLAVGMAEEVLPAARALEQMRARQKEGGARAARPTGREAGALNRAIGRDPLAESMSNMFGGNQDIPLYRRSLFNIGFMNKLEKAIDKYLRDRGLEDF